MKQFIAAARYFTLAESLGGFESLVAHPATIIHAGMGEEARASAGMEGEQDLVPGQVRLL